MNKSKIKILLIFVFLIFTTGCQVKTDITINKDLTVLEELNLTGTSEFFQNHYKNMPMTVVKTFFNTNDHEKTLIENGYSYEIKKEDKYPYVYVSKKYTSIDEFASKTIFKKQYFEDLIVDVNDNLITLKSFNYIDYEDGDLERYDIKKFSFNIKVPFTVVNHNADKHDKKTNTYTWYINAETKEKEINLTFDKNKIYVYNLVMYISISILILLLIILVFVFRNVVKKGKLNNRVSE